MEDEGGLSRGTFMRLAEASGLDVHDTAHMEELYAFYLQSVVPSLKAIHALDLADVEPAMIFISSP